MLDAGFLSINSCAKSNFTDANGIYWITDDGWFPDGTSCQQSTVPTQSIPSKTVRTFDVKSGKICYNLTTTSGHDYLIRATFLRERSDSLLTVLIGVTPIALVNSSEDSAVVEGIFRAKEEYTDLCLWRQRGHPYISGVEVRDLNGLGYLNGGDSSNYVLKVVSRVSFGSTGGIIRYVFLLLLLNASLIIFFGASLKD